jgi:signal peptidase II
MFFGIALVVVALDQYTKVLVRENLPLNVSWMPIPWLDPLVTLTYVRNAGAAFGLFPGLGGVFRFVALGVVVTIIVFSRQLAASSWPLRLAFGLQLGGATGNLIDRMVLGHVVDFIDVRVWPIFNIADSAIVVGTALLAYYALFVEPAAARKAEAPSQKPYADGEPG